MNRAVKTPTKEQQLAEVHKLAEKYGIKLGKSPLVTDLLAVLQKLDEAEERIAELEREVFNARLDAEAPF